MTTPEGQEVITIRAVADITASPVRSQHFKNTAMAADTISTRTEPPTTWASEKVTPAIRTEAVAISRTPVSVDTEVVVMVTADTVEVDLEEEAVDTEVVVMEAEAVTMAGAVTEVEVFTEETVMVVAMATDTVDTSRPCT